MDMTTTKWAQKRAEKCSHSPVVSDSNEDSGENSVPTSSVNSKRNHDPDRYKLFFQTESNDEIEERKRKARMPIIRFEKKQLEITLEEIYKPGTVLDMPKRPRWSYTMSKHEVEKNEEKMFIKYVDDIKKENLGSQLSYFEMNLETWRQLWRVLEVSDIVLIITDVRYPVIHFSPTLYTYVRDELKKDIVLVLNKIDLVTPEVVVSWKCYFQEKFPHLHIVCFTSFPKDPEEIRQLETKVKKHLGRKKKKSFMPIGPLELHSICTKIVDGKVNLKDWLSHIENESNGGVTYDEMLSSDEDEGDSSTYEDVEKQEGILTIGLVGHPNVGKSSLLNGLVGKKVVSCSRTPGHTKHFQTIFLTPNVRLCDSPGLVFPSLVDRRLQILSGTYPIAQVREPYSVVGYMAACIPLENTLNLVHPKIAQLEDDESIPKDIEWSAWDICDAWAEQRGFRTAKAGRPDTYRAANSLLRLATQGKIVMCLYPPGFFSKQDEWKDHPETKEIAKLQQQFSDLKQWRLNENCTQCELERESSEDTDEDSDTNNSLQMFNPYLLLQEED
ncbi:guanine nucleotide-binding protein-like 1 isoform X2 [Xenia sp. Carnegie-2017]|uniref:guanine nucleotide-binding protein-like 1 isoform X2 n=1 Tax=Xenia sp. Carnegie-2017 TaxID=2897299 RepID=UPI001F04AC99|nr:guanine nucleotide-binding protein-like 1 isoform X2 [Xenia sp. Carnegie-2017]